MRAVKKLAATLNVIVGGYLLLLANGTYTAMRDRALGFHIHEVPSIRWLVSSSIRPLRSHFNSYRRGC
jgi:hypothetical protein